MIRADGGLVPREKQPSESDNVNHPVHYGGKDNPYEAIKVIEAWLSPEGFRDFLRGNILKYISRAEKKGGVEDYRKAYWYMERLIEHYERSGKA